MTVTVHTAPVILPITQPPLADAAVAIDADRILTVGDRRHILSQFPRADVVGWDGVLMPGLVNAHTHLQYTSFAAVGASHHSTYVGWSERFVEEYETRTGEDWKQTARRGVEEGLRHGTTCFADVVTDVEAMGVLAEAGVAGVAYFEIIGVDEARWSGGVAEQVAEILATSPRTGVAGVGLSPHAPYSIDQPILAEAATLARHLGVRLHVHLAEVDSEDEFYRSGSGALAERVALRVRRPWTVLTEGGVGMGAAEFARANHLLGPDSHMAHGVYLDRQGRQTLKAAGTYAALCPRSNVTVGVDPPPVASWLSEDALFAVGTDSLGSSPSLDPLEDVALLRQLAVEGGYDRADLDRRLLEAATLGGAKALGLGSVVGAIAPGRRADMAVFAIDSTPRNAERALVEAGAGNCVATILAGRVVSSVQTHSPSEAR